MRAGLDRLKSSQTPDSPDLVFLHSGSGFRSAWARVYMHTTRTRYEIPEHARSFMKSLYCIHRQSRTPDRTPMPHPEKMALKKPRIRACTTNQAQKHAQAPLTEAPGKKKTGGTEVRKPVFLWKTPMARSKKDALRAISVQRATTALGFTKMRPQKALTALHFATKTRTELRANTIHGQQNSPTPYSDCFGRIRKVTHPC